jgi:hypothetical protein
LSPDAIKVKRSSQLGIIGYSEAGFRRVLSMNGGFGSVSQLAIAKKGIDDVREDSEEIVYTLSAEKGMDGSLLVCVDAY